MSARKKQERLEGAGEQVEERAELTRDLPVFVPATSIYELPDSLVVYCDVPGVSRGDLDVSLEKGLLTITGYQRAREPEGYQLLHRGYGTGVFRRSFTVVEDIDQDGITASLRNGVLELVLPRSRQPGPMKIEVGQ
ncbi:Hsp20/alpha crystallin family protein [Candidatus Fermentibacterales bacterium]|nr:Hsp20/alpha crystallin family protein [Candidatus Fermentibacterales bacterium]